MAEQIIDGTGKGYRASVAVTNQLRIVGPAIDFNHHIAHEHQQVFFVPLAITPSGAGSIFCYLSNTDNQRDLCLTKLSVYAAGAEYIEIWHSPTGTPSGTTTLSPVNSTVGSGTIANCVAYSGVSIGGLTGCILSR